MVVALTHRWRFWTGNLDGVNWPDPEHDDTDWSGPAPALLAVESNEAVFPRLTFLPVNFQTGLPFTTYYLRTEFTFDHEPAGVSLKFSSYVDDGAVFYFNGTEVYRLRMPEAPVLTTNQTLATSSPCGNQDPNRGDAWTNCADVFLLSPPLNTHLRRGRNVLAVEVHNNSLNGNDLVFGTTVGLDHFAS